MNEFTQTPHLVNYITSTTNAANEKYVEPTESPVSMAFLIKNSFIIQFSQSLELPVSGDVIPPLR